MIGGPMAKKQERFIKTWSDGAFGSNEIWVDTKTGVNYLFHASGYAGGLTVLVDREGKPIITAIPVEESYE